MIATIDLLLRSEARFAPRAGRPPWGAIALLLCTGGFLYGAVMGSFDARPLQSLYSGLKVPLFLVTTSLVCLPNFFVINTVLGLRDDFAVACRGVFAAQATVAICLVALAPLTVLAYVSSDNYQLAKVINGVYFAIATVAGQMTLTHYYRELEANNPLHRIGRISWVCLYIFVGIQLAWVLRPYIGSPDIETRFFREDSWSNAYIAVLRDVWAVLSGS